MCDRIIFVYLTLSHATPTLRVQVTCIIHQLGRNIKKKKKLACVLSVVLQYVHLFIKLQTICFTVMNIEACFFL